MPERTRDRQADPVRAGSTGADPVESSTVQDGPTVGGPLDPAESTPVGSVGVPSDGVAERVREAASGLTTLLHEAEAARRLRAEVAGGEGASAVCAWNHFENIPTFYNWNNRPR